MLGNGSLGFSGWQVVDGRPGVVRLRRPRRPAALAWARSILRFTMVAAAVSVSLLGVVVLCLGWIAAFDWTDGVLLRGVYTLTGSL